ncbi:MAG TPA: hypothetical protein DIT64_17085 [Verrucomicrobiales bacterium]|nr:hypothetical protein [Verrucomicrobiales bacterium]HRJ08766.1 hypothetical protein [Prosthecobacter sp.]HRK15289.1 hypothetical protein [Prosthecobacter sp.]
MIFRRLRLRVLLLLALFGAVSAGVGFFLGIAAAKGAQKKKDDPAVWRQAALRRLEGLRPDEAQKPRLEARVDQAVKDLADLRVEGIRRVWEVVDGAVHDIEAELTPEQREAFEKMKPRPPKEAR